MKARTLLVGVVSAACALSWLSWSGAASAQDHAAAASREDTQTTADSTPALGTVDRLRVMTRLEVGYRGSFVTDPGYNPFSTQDYFSQSSIAISRTILVSGRYSFAPGVMWDYGKSGATARGDSTSLEIHRLSAPLEGRMHFGAWGYAFLRAAPGVALESAEIDDLSSPTGSLKKNRWLFSTDVSAGYAFPILPRASAYAITPRAWLQSDVGYGAIVAQRLDLAPDVGSGDPTLTKGVDLGTLSMHGVFWRLAAAVSF